MFNMPGDERRLIDPLATFFLQFLSRLLDLRVASAHISLGSWRGKEKSSRKKMVSSIVGFVGFASLHLQGII